MTFKLKITFALFFFILSFVFISPVSAAVRLNEIYPAPPTGEFEWVELYNDEDTTIDLSTYTLSDPTEKFLKFDNTIIGPNSFLIATSSGVLNNSGDIVFLKTGNETVETATYSASFDSSKSFAKCPDGTGSWFTTTAITKNSSNIDACPTSTPTPSPTPPVSPTPIVTETPTPTLTSTPTLTPTPAPVEISNIFLSEVMANPDTGEKEWVEIYNDNDIAVTLENWSIDDIENAGSSPKQFTLTIEAKNYIIYDLSSSMFNNDGDSVRLLDTNKNVIDSFEYTTTTKTKSLGRVAFDTDIYCIQEPTKNSSNNTCIDPTPTPTLTPTKTPTLTKTPTPTKLLTPTKVPTTFVARRITDSTGRPVDTSYNSSLVTSNNEYNENIVVENDEEILGVNDTTAEKKQKDMALLKSLSFASSSTSLVTITSILIKIKKALSV